MACYVAGGIEICEARGSFEVEGGDGSAEDGEGEGEEEEEEEERNGDGVHVFFSLFFGGLFWLALVVFGGVRGVEEVGGWGYVMFVARGTRLFEGGGIGRERMKMMVRTTLPKRNI